jgi:hypothetical protein
MMPSVCGGIAPHQVLSRRDEIVDTFCFFEHPGLVPGLAMPPPPLFADTHPAAFEMAGTLDGPRHFGDVEAAVAVEHGGFDPSFRSLRVMNGGRGAVIDVANALGRESGRVEGQLGRSNGVLYPVARSANTVAG